MKEALKHNPFLSPTYQSWYANILSEKIDLGEININSATSQIKGGVHPHYVLLGKSSAEGRGKYDGEVVCSQDIRDQKGDEVVVSNSLRLLEFIKKDSRLVFSDYHSQLPPITTTRMFLDIGTQPRLLFIPGCKEAYVVVGINSPSEYLDNYYLVRRMTDQPNQGDVAKVVGEVGFVKSRGRNFFISRFVGFDFETEITDRGILSLKKPLYLTTRRVDDLSTQHGIFLRNLGPRNLIHGPNNAVYIVDFDHVYKLAEHRKEDLYTHELSRKLWFGDILEPAEIETLFAALNTEVGTDWTKADTFERKLFGKTEISLKEKEMLYQMIRRFESKDFMYETEIFGHQLGRFISDFWGEESEAELYKYLFRNPETCRELRFVLYLLSRMDQELLLRQKYGMDTEKELLSLAFFNRLLVGGNLLSNPENLTNILHSKRLFGSKYLEILASLFR